MENQLKVLYDQKIEQSQLDFDSDPEYKQYYTQAEALWEGEDMPPAVFHLLEVGNFLAFAHGFRLGARLTGWARAD